MEANRHSAEAGVSVSRNHLSLKFGKQPAKYDRAVINVSDSSHQLKGEPDLSGKAGSLRKHRLRPHGRKHFIMLLENIEEAQNMEVPLKSQKERLWGGTVRLPITFASKTTRK